MSISKVFTISLLGLDGVLVEVEVDISPGLQTFQIVGMAGKSVQESKERVSAAIKHSGFMMPAKRIIVNLAPASLIKNDPFYDLPIAIAILKATNQINIDLSDSIFWGELSLDNKTRGCKGALVVADSVKKLGFSNFFLPHINANEAGMIAGINVFGIDSLKQLVVSLVGGQQITPFRSSLDNSRNAIKNRIDMSQVKGQHQARRAVEIAAAGGHNILMTGVPGAGKTFIAKAMQSILPEMDIDEKIEVSKIHSVAGMLNEKGLIGNRPFRSPHHTSSQVSLIGGGAIPRPGEVSLAHRGVLFLDEFNEFQNIALEALRQPIEDSKVVIARASGVMTFPSDFILLAAMNPCKCGYFGDEDKECICTPAEIQRHSKKVSGPIMDRIDLQIHIKRIRNSELLDTMKGEGSKDIKARVEQARRTQSNRTERLKLHSRTNASLGSKEVEQVVDLDDGSRKLMMLAVDKLRLSGRAYTRTLKVARTIADLGQRDNVSKTDLEEALSMRMG